MSDSEFIDSIKEILSTDEEKKMFESVINKNEEDFLKEICSDD